MKKLTFILSVLLLTSCGTKMGLKLEKNDSETVSLYIDKFPNFGYMFSTSPVLMGDNANDLFSEIDKELFDYLKSNTTTESKCRVYTLETYTDNYGKSSSEYVERYGLDLDELRKYESSTYWSTATCGIKFIKYGECN